MHPPDLIGSFEVRKFLEIRTPTIDTMRWGSKRHHIPILLEIDVTDARVAIRAQKKLGQRIGFTGWIVKCIAQAVSEHKSVQALRQGKRLVVFDDVDVAILVERAVGESGAGETLPMPFMIRKANEKTVATIHAEICAAQQQPLVTGEVQYNSARASWLIKFYTRLPGIVRDLFFWQPLFGNPFLIKQKMGTIGITVIGISGQSGMSWGIPIGIHPLLVAVGAIAKRPGVVDEQIAIREYVGLTILFDHDVIDGAPVARFIRRLQELITGGYGLGEAQEMEG
jgi:pyruvate/2-oxoglutarate dehydrogenase complex dihydrolipoamide acyltransferase (E2) component